MRERAWGFLGREDDKATPVEVDQMKEETARSETMAFGESRKRVCGSNEMFPEITRRLKGCRKALGGIHVNVIDRQRSVVGPRTA